MNQRFSGGGEFAPLSIAFISAHRFIVISLSVT